TSSTSQRGRQSLVSGRQHQPVAEGSSAVPSEIAATLQHLTPPAICSEIALQANVLEHFTQTLARCGVVGEERLGATLYLALTSRLLRQPVSIAVKGPSSGGKSYSVGKVLGFFPRSAYHELSAM